MRFLVCALFLFSLLISCDDLKQDADPTIHSAKEITELPFRQIALNDLSDFAVTGSNWTVAGYAFCDFDQRHHLESGEGSGVLVCDPTEDDNAHLATAFEHQDIELTLDVIVPKGSNSGIYFMGRYEVQIFDSWLVAEPTHADMGGIYQRWDETRPENAKGYEGVSPHINAALAPGLWQTFHISFKAPRFDSDGNKTENARFEFVYLNDQLLHEDLEVSGPTRAHQLEGEEPSGPLYFQGDHGPVAFRNMQYKLYRQDSISLSPISYTSFVGRQESLPDFDTLTSFETGVASSFDPKDVAPQDQEFSIVYTGQMNVPHEGEYLFEIGVDDGAALYIDDQLVVLQDDEPQYAKSTGTILLSAGAHDYSIQYRQEVWSARLDVEYEGPFIRRRKMGHKTVVSNTAKPRKRLVLDNPASPTLLRGFVKHHRSKLTHAISVGDPTGIHYSYDLPSASLAKIWRGAFGDVTEMWQGRGIQQILTPVSTAPELPLAYPSTKSMAGTEWLQSPAVYEGYTIGMDKRPVFHYAISGQKISDRIVPSDPGLLREITCESADPIYLRLGSCEKIEQISDNIFSLENVYVKTSQPGQLTINNLDDGQELVAKINSSFTYEIIW